MPRYYFRIRSCDQRHEDERCAVLQDVEAALGLCLSNGSGAKRQRMQ